MKAINKSILSAATRIAKTGKAKALFLSLDSLSELPDENLPKGCKIIYVTRRLPSEMEKFFPEGVPPTLALIHLPKIDMTRMTLVKMAVLLALYKQMIKLGDKIVFIAGLSEMEILDSIMLIDTGKEAEIITTQGLNGFSDRVNPEVFQTVLSFAIELATRGREGKPVGTIFVLGDEEKVLQLSKQMIINPFKGYTDEERNVLNPELRETMREFAAIDGAFVVSGDGLVLTAGRHLGAASNDASLPRGFGSRHIAASGITAMTQAVAIVISESTGDVRIFKNGKILMEIEKASKPPLSNP